MDAALVAHYAGDSSRRGPAPDGALTGAAGGSVCGDLVRVSVVIADGVIDAVTFDAEGCAAATAAAAAVAELAEGAHALQAAAIGAADVSEALGGLSPPDQHSCMAPRLWP